VRQKSNDSTSAACRRHQATLRRQEPQRLGVALALLVVLYLLLAMIP
tara:strand:+ start:1024 stop:1164 length:141 start_codon:yes stop_codon:yes gene_type:complete